jgi:hypothetical protein
VVLKEQLISLLNPLTDILHSLRTHQLPKRVMFAPFGDMRLKFSATQVLAIHPVVPLMKSNAVAINDPSSIDRTLKIFIPLMLI